MSFTNFVDIAKTDILEVIKSVTSSEKNLVANLANITAIIKETFDYHWVGFYFVDEVENNLVLGPFQGPIACTRIPYGRGVCGTSWRKAETLNVPNVHNFDEHIACSTKTNSELVIPILIGSKVRAILDIDSVSFDEFNDEAIEVLSSICRYIETEILITSEM